MRVLFPVDELYPLYKIGGLGDVGGSLPKALFNQGIDVRPVLPAHPEVNLTGFVSVMDYAIHYDDEDLPVQVLAGVVPDTNITVYLVKEDKYISQATDASDNHADKFAVFSLAVAKMLEYGIGDWSPELVHLHDWHTGLIPLIAKDLLHLNQFKFMITIHNLAYQGRTTTPVLTKIGFDNQYQLERLNRTGDGHLNILLEGILSSDLVVAVSQNYAREITTSEYGEGVDQFLLDKGDKLVGIVNGLDLEVFNSATDKHLFTRFDRTSVVAGKQANRRALLEQLNWPIGLLTPLLGFVGRVDVKQKGVQLIIEAIEAGALGTKDRPFIFLGVGDTTQEQQLHQAATGRDYVKIFTEYNEPLAVQIYAASDLMLIPSKFEPCGLVQMIAMRYGALPVARATGGLTDTIIHDHDGFLFAEYHTTAFINAIDDSLSKVSDKNHLNELRKNAMIKDFSWEKSAQTYIHYYSTLTN